MNPYGELAFFCVLAVTLTPAVILGLLGKSLRICGMLACTALLLVIFDTWAGKLTLLGFWAWQTALCCGYGRLRQSVSRQWVFWIFLTLSLLPLLLTKLAGVLPGLSVPGLLGVSYMTFRAVQVLLDCYDGHLTNVNALDFSYFLLFAPSVSSGPLDRYRRFVQDLHTPPGRENYAELLRDGVWRLMTGALYNFVFGGLIWNLWVAKLPAHGVLPTLSYFYGYTFFMFFNFAGYSRMAVGTAYLLGIRMPDNFNRPFLGVDLKDFWARWHISLSTWLRDYVYTRFCMAALRRKWFKGRRTSSYVGNFLTMVLMGLWHGLTPGYLLYGVYHGSMMCLNDVLDARWKRFRIIKKGLISRWIMRFITFHVFAFGLLIFSGRIL